ncbi:MAG: NUDIX domain-containing protein [Rickettsiaceae bacterium]|nr:MAG: NUDIX domain-containing protein [Rickettsiaceae bacterium]
MTIIKERFKAAVATHLLLINSAQEILLSLRHNTGYADNLYSVVAGHVEAGENVVAATVREAKEEANLLLAAKDIEFVHVLHNRTSADEIGYIDFFFIAKNWPDTILNLEPEKCKELKFFPLDNLPLNMVPYIAQAIKCFKQKISQSIYGWGT